jgi:hypothetical protein
LQRFYRAKLGILGSQADASVAFFLQNPQDFFASIASQDVREKAPGPDDDAKSSAFRHKKDLLKDELVSGESAGNSSTPWEQKKPK